MSGDRVIGNTLHSPFPNLNADSCYLAGVVEELVLKFLDAQDLLEHLVQLVLAEDELGGGAGRHALLLLARVLVAAIDGVELGHPGAEHRLLAEPVDLRQAAHTLLNVLLEDLAAVVGREATALHHARHAVTLQEHLSSRESRDLLSDLPPASIPSLRRNV